MNLNSLKVYVITYNCININYRAARLLELGERINIKLICCKANNTREIENIIQIKKQINLFSVFRKLKLKFLYNYLNKSFYFPSPLVLYCKNVISYLKNEIARNNETRFILITICPPHDIALIGYSLKKEFPNIKWLNDLQDLWTFDDYYFNQLSNRFKRKAQRVEGKLLDTADRTIVTNDYARDWCLKKFNISKEKILSIYHPYESFSFTKKFSADELLNRIKYKKKIRLAFVGSLFKEPKVPGSYLINELKRFSNVYNWPLEFVVIGSVIPLELKDTNTCNFVIKDYPMLSH